MNVIANATRIIRGENQVIIVTGQVDSNSAQSVLPQGREYTGKFLEIYAKGGSVFFSFEVEAVEGKSVEVAPLPSELTRFEQEEIFLRTQLNDPNLSEPEKATIRERLGVPAPVAESHDAEPV